MKSTEEEAKINDRMNGKFLQKQTAKDWMEFPPISNCCNFGDHFSILAAPISNFKSLEFDKNHLPVSLN